MKKPTLFYLLALVCLILSGPVLGFLADQIRAPRSDAADPSNFLKPGLRRSISPVLKAGEPLRLPDLAATKSAGPMARCKVRGVQEFNQDWPVCVFDMPDGRMGGRGPPRQAVFQRITRNYPLISKLSDAATIFCRRGGI